MSVLYLVPAAAMWLIYAALSALGVPWWIDYPFFGLTCAATSVGLFIAWFSSVGPRW